MSIKQFYALVAAHATTCPDGEYPGVQTGSEYEWTADSRDWIGRSEFGVRGAGLKMTVTVKDGKASSSLTN